MSMTAKITSETDNTMVQLMRYTVVGGAAYVLDASTLFALTHWAGVHYLYSAAVGFMAGLALNYALSVAWVFPRRKLGSRGAEFALFGGIGLVGLGLNELLMWALVAGAGLHYMLAKVGAAVVVYMWNFLARKYILFN